MISLDVCPDGRLLIYKGTVANQLLSLLKEAAESDARTCILQDPSLTISWNSTGRPGPTNRTVVFYRRATITVIPSCDPNAMAFRIFQPPRTLPKYARPRGKKGKKTDLLFIRAAGGQVWISPQFLPYL